MRYQQPQQYPQPAQPMQPVPNPMQVPMPQQMPPQYVPMPPYAPQEPMAPYMPPEPRQPMAPYAPQEPPQPVAQATMEQPVAPPDMDCPVPLSREFRRIAGMYFKDTWQMLLGLIGLMLIIFVAVRLATRGYLWGLVFVLLAALALELPALGKLAGYLADKTSGRMLVRTAGMSSITEQQPSLLARLGLSSKVRYALQDDQGRSYYFVADKGLAGNFGDLEGMEAEIAFLEKSQLMTGIHPVRRTEHLSVMESARERHMRHVFREYLP